MEMFCNHRAGTKRRSTFFYPNVGIGSTANSCLASRKKQISFCEREERARKAEAEARREAEARARAPEAQLAAERKANEDRPNGVKSANGIVESASGTSGRIAGGSNAAVRLRAENANNFHAGRKDDRKKD